MGLNLWPIQMSKGFQSNERQVLYAMVKSFEMTMGQIAQNVEGRSRSFVKTVKQYLWTMLELLYVNGIDEGTKKMGG